MDGITSFIVEHFYRDDRSLVDNKRISAIVGACYLLNLRRFHPEVFSERDERLLSTLLGELDLEEHKAEEVLAELTRDWKDGQE